MARFVVLLSIPGLRARDLSSMPNLSRLFVGGGNAILIPSFPAVTCPVQANMTTGCPPRQHGVVANGFYWRDQRRVEMWTAWNDCIEKPQIWDVLHDRDRAITSAVWFALHSKGSGADYICTPAPVHNADGSESPWCFTRPEGLYDELKAKRATSRCKTFGDRSPEFNRRPGSSTRRSSRPKNIAPTSSTFTCRTSITPHRRAAPTARPRIRPSPTSTPSWENSSPVSRRPTREAPLWLAASEYVITPVNDVVYPEPHPARGRPAKSQRNGRRRAPRFRRQQSLGAGRPPVLARLRPGFRSQRRSSAWPAYSPSGPASPKC